MESLAPYIPHFFLATVASVYFTLLVGLNAACRKAGYEKQKRLKVVVITAVALGVWIGLLIVLGVMGIFNIGEARPPKIMGVLLPPVITIVVLMISKPFKQLLDTTPPNWATGLQSFRIGVEIVLFLLAVNALAPVEMSFEGRNFDILVGISAIGITFWLGRQPEKARKAVIVWNFLGMAILAVVVVTGIGSALGVIETHPKNTFIGEFPYMLLPGFLVPAAYFLHLVSLRQLWRSKA